jgi:hypothetical protein
VSVSYVANEGVHFRCHSSDNTLQYSSVSHTGRDKKNLGFGEAVYIGTAESNWSDYPCLNNGPDKSNRNRVLDNKLGPEVTGECVDIKEGTVGGLIQGNSFDGNALSNEKGARSWVNCKGEEYVITQNKGKNSIEFGFRVSFEF